MKLSEEQKRFVVRYLARWKTPTEVVELFTEEWPETKGKFDRRQAQKYDPTGARCPTSPKLQELFWELRKSFNEALDETAIGQLRFRLEELLELYRVAKKSRNIVEARNCLEQAAKETGGMFTNKRIHSGVVGYRDLSKATDEQLDAILAGADPEDVLQDGGFDA